MGSPGDPTLLAVPRQANAGLNFYLSNIQSVGLGFQSIILVFLPDPGPFLFWVSLILIGTTLLSTLVPQPIFSLVHHRIEVGLWVRAIATCVLVSMLLSHEMLGLSPEQATGVVLALFGFNFLFHKTYFNFGWLIFMGRIVPEADADDYVARVRRFNFVISSGLTWVFTLISAFVGVTEAAVFSLISVALYSLWAAMTVSMAHAAAAHIFSDVQVRVAQSMSALRPRDILFELKQPDNRAWVALYLSNALLLPPLVGVYLIEVRGFDRDIIIPTLAIASACTMLVLPELSRVVGRLHQAILVRMAMTVRIGFWALLSVIALVEVPLTIIVIALPLTIFLGMAANQLAGVRIHNSVVMTAHNDPSRPGLLPFYNLVLDLTPLVYIAAFGATMMLEARWGWPVYTMAYGIVVTIWSLSVARTVSTSKNRRDGQT